MGQRSQSPMKASAPRPLRSWLTTCYRSGASRRRVEHGGLARERSAPLRTLGFPPSVSARRLDPGGRDGRARPGGRGDRRRSGATLATRSPVTTRMHPRNRWPRTAVIGGRREEHPVPGHRGDGRPSGAELPNRERCRSGVFQGDRRGGGAPPRQPRGYTVGILAWPP